VAAILAEGFITYHALLFEDQTLEPVDEERAMGLVDVVEPTGLYGQSFRIPGHPAIRVLSNIVDGERRIGIVMGKQGPEWHVDGTSAGQAPIASQLYCLEANDVGGDTLFANSHLAFETLPAASRARVDGLMATYNSDHLQRKLAVYDNRPLDLTGAPDARWPIVATHPVTGRKGLYFSGGDMVSIDGLDEDERLALVAELSEHLFARPHLAYRHRWQPGDLLVWDNRSVMHSATTYDYDGHPRRLHHIVGGGARSAMAAE
jgi:alpha-ketoglutarate-dependent taurine dioxygenase